MLVSESVQPACCYLLDFRKPSRASMEGGPADNLLLLVDSYKVSHYRQYPPGTTTVYSYFESRGGRFPYTVFFGLQYIIKRWLLGPVVTKEKIAEAKALLKLHFSGEEIFNEEGWQYILEKHGGHIPLQISAVPEGSVVPTKNVLFSVQNTDPKLPWLTSFFETLLVQVWYPMTVATNSRIQKQIIQHHLSTTHDNTNSLPFKLHDFGFRGATSVESAALGGAAHLVNFKGTDTLAALSLLRKAYHSDMPGFSIAASEHSTMTSWGKEREIDACRNMLEAFPSGIIACVSDSYNIWKCCEEIWGNKLKDLVVERGERDGVLLVRPDSGDPPSVVVRCLEILGKAFGTEQNTKGFKILPSFLRIVQGDGISYSTLGRILERMKEEGWSAENVVFGSGGALLQKVDRDTQKCAYKCSYVEINGKGHNVYKEPITDMGKKSKKGKLSLHCNDGEYTTIEEGKGSPETDLLVPVFKDGVLLQDYTLEQVRTNAELRSHDTDILSFLEADSALS